MPDEELQGLGINDDEFDTDETEEDVDNDILSLDQMGEEEDDPDMDTFDDVDEF